MSRFAVLALSLPVLLGYGACEPSPSAPDRPGDSGSPFAAPDDPDAPTCLPVRQLRCGDVVDADNGDWNQGATDTLDFYDVAVGNYRGPELTFWFDATATETASLELVDPAPSVLNHDLFVLDARQGCTSAAAVEYGFNSVDVDVVAGERYYVVVDGFDGHHGEFRLGLDCDGAPDDDAPPEGTRPDPFAPQPDTAEGLTNVAGSLTALLEDGSLDGACDAWRANPTDRRAKLLCGKHRFFYEPMGTDGIPLPLLDWVGRNFPDFAGEGFTGFGLIRDPYAAVPRALGFGPSGTFGNADAYGMTCASCHFGRMPDGRYAVGYPNHEYDYGTHMLALMVGVKAGMPTWNPDDHHPDAVTAVQPMLDRFAADPFLGLGMMMNMIPLLTALNNVPVVPYAAEGEYASWRTGTMDFLTPPLSADDGVHTVSRILPLWGIADEADFAAYGTDHAQLGWTGGTRTILDFARAFVHMGGGDLDQWTDRELEPLQEYILSLRAPDAPSPSSPERVEAGRAVFDGACISCHGGPRGGGLDIYDWQTIGTDDALADWGAPAGDGELCCGLSDYDHSYDTEGVKAPRLVGVGTFSRVLHNGSLDSLEQLLCLAPRPASHAPPFAAGGHTFGCGSLSEAARTDLITFLRTL